MLVNTVRSRLEYGDGRSSESSLTRPSKHNLSQITCRTNMRRRFRVLAFVWLSFFLAALPSIGKEGPYFVTYNQKMEEPNDLEIGINAVRGKPRDGNAFLGSWMEFEYGTREWWTTEVYLDGQWTKDQSTIFTGFRIENRFRPLKGNHRINPVLYTEFEDINGADKTLLETVGFDSQGDLAVPNDIARREHEREIENRLIVGGDFKGWNWAGDFIAEKNLSNKPWEFGYAAGISRPIALAGPLHAFQAGIEFYGGLGDRYRFTVHDTSQYLGVCLAWKLPGGAFLRVSPEFGLTHQSGDFLMRFGISHEISHVGHHIRSWF